MSGFRHLLEQDDLDKAASLCTSLKGHLKARFIVLSDDRVLPPPPNKSGKRNRDADEREDDQSNVGTQKKTRGVAGVSRISGSGRGARGRGAAAATRQTPPRFAKEVRGQPQRGSSSASSRAAPANAGSEAAGHGYFSVMDLDEGEEIPSDVDLAQG